MVEHCMASIHHWRSRDDCKPKNLSIGYWQASRVASLLRRSEAASRHALICLDLSRDLGPFLLGYAHEAASRAALIGGELRLAEEHLLEAKGRCAEVTDAESRRMLDADLVDLDAQSSEASKKASTETSN